MSAERYDVVVIGGGGAGSEATYRIGETKRFKVGLVERHMLGGECNWYGCVPTKAMLRAARIVHTARHAEPFGIRIKDVEVDFPKVMQRVQSIVTYFTRYGTKPFDDIGVKVWLGGTASFMEPNKIAIDEEEIIIADQVVIATGTKAAIPPVPGLRESSPWTNEEAVQQTELPGSLAIVGAGPIGVEFAQIYSRLGTKVTVIEALDRALPPEDADASAVVAEMFADEGIHFYPGARIELVDEHKTLHLKSGESIKADAILVAAGRTPSFGLLEPNNAGIELDEKGRPVLDASLRTTQPHIFAAGDATGDLLFTHVASYEGELVAKQIVENKRLKTDYRIVPKVTYCEPEIASVGITEAQARADGIDVRVGKLDFADNERSYIDGSVRGMVKVVADAKTGHVLGASIAGEGAGEMIHEIVGIMASGGTVKKAGAAIHAYPTLSESVKGALMQATG